MATIEIIGIIIAATIPLLIFYFGYRLERKQNRIERKHKARIQFELAAIFLGPQAGYYIAEVTMVLQNKGLVRNMIENLHLKLLGIKQEGKIELLDLKDKQQGSDQIAKFPEMLVNKNILEKKGSYFVEPEVIQQFTYVARIPDDIRFLLVRSRFKYHEHSTHSAQKVFEVKPNN